jgi:hypothetical protein
MFVYDMHVCVYIHTHMYVCESICIIYIYIYPYTYAHTHIFHDQPQHCFPRLADLRYDLHMHELECARVIMCACLYTYKYLSMFANRYEIVCLASHCVPVHLKYKIHFSTQIRDCFLASHCGRGAVEDLGSLRVLQGVYV